MPLLMRMTWIQKLLALPKDSVSRICKFQSITQILKYAGVSLAHKITHYQVNRREETGRQCTETLHLPRGNDGYFSGSEGSYAISNRPSGKCRL